jgi:DNA-binding MarR family transcriptional regulator
MTVPAAPSAPAVPFGQALGEAARQASALHQRLLDHEGSSFLEWVVLNLVSANDGPTSRDSLIKRLTDELSIDEAPVRQVIDSLAAAGRLLSDTPDGEDCVRLSDAGCAYHQHLREKVGQATTELLGPFDATEIATSVRVLVAVKERAPAILPS